MPICTPPRSAPHACSRRSANVAPRCSMTVTDRAAIDAVTAPSSATTTGRPVATAASRVSASAAAAIDAAWWGVQGGHNRVLTRPGTGDFAMTRISMAAKLGARGPAPARTALTVRETLPASREQFAEAALRSHRGPSASLSSTTIPPCAKSSRYPSAGWSRRLPTARRAADAGDAARSGRARLDAAGHRRRRGVPPPARSRTDTCRHAHRTQ
jgi:hypothetical protein